MINTVVVFMVYDNCSRRFDGQFNDDSRHPPICIVGKLRKTPLKFHCPIEISWFIMCHIDINGGKYFVTELFSGQIYHVYVVCYCAPRLMT